MVRGEKRKVLTFTPLVLFAVIYQSKSIYEHVIQVKRAFNRVSQFFSTKFIFIFYKILI